MMITLLYYHVNANYWYLWALLISFIDLFSIYVIIKASKRTFNRKKRSFNETSTQFILWKVSFRGATFYLLLLITSNSFGSAAFHALYEFHICLFILYCSQFI